jgi:hypothetical protein
MPQRSLDVVRMIVLLASRMLVIFLAKAEAASVQPKLTADYADQRG